MVKENKNTLYFFRRYFIDDHSMKDHFRTKVHKRRLKALELEPYSIAESERAAGHGSFIEAKRRKIETQPSKEPEEMKVDE